MSRDLRVHFSSEDPNFRTPPEVLDPIRRFRPIHIDPFGNPDSLVDAAVTICPPRNSLIIPWPRVGLFFANPPYGRQLVACAAKIAAEAAQGAEGITLVPARTDTKWWRVLAPLRWCAWQGRITFLETWAEWLARKERVWRRSGQTGPLPPVEPRCRVGELVADDPAPFPVALCYHGPFPDEFTAHFERYGTIYAPAGAPAAAGRRHGVTGRRPAPRVSLARVGELLNRGFSVREMAAACGAKKHQIEFALRQLRAQREPLGLSENVHVLGQSTAPPTDLAPEPATPAGLSENVHVFGQDQEAAPDPARPTRDPLEAFLLSIADSPRALAEVDPEIVPALHRDYLAVQVLVPGRQAKRRTLVPHLQITEFGLRRIGRLPARKSATSPARPAALAGA